MDYTRTRCHVLFSCSFVFLHRALEGLKHAPNHFVFLHAMDETGVRHVSIMAESCSSNIDSMFSLSVSRQVLQALTLILILSVANVSLPPLLALWRGIDALSLGSLRQATVTLQQSHGIMLSACLFMSLRALSMSRVTLLIAIQILQPY